MERILVMKRTPHLKRNIPVSIATRGQSVGYKLSNDPRWQTGQAVEPARICTGVAGWIELDVSHGRMAERLGLAEERGAWQD
jgi:hypothetical protein